MLNLRLIGQLAGAEGDEEDYKALVCLFLAGGNDSFNMLLPSSGDGYVQYLESRQNLALGEDEILDLGHALPDGRTMGIHSSMPGLSSLFQNGNAAFVANVGSLVEPVTLSEIREGAADLPLGLFSHSDQQKHWQTALPTDRNALNGFAGRLADSLQDLNTVSGTSMNISLSGQNIFQTGNQVLPFTVGPSGAAVLKSDDRFRLDYEARHQARLGLLDQHYQSTYAQAFASAKNQAIEANELYNAAILGAPDFSAQFTESNRLAGEFSQIAKAIASRDKLANKRQTFFIEIGGFDLHDQLNRNHPGLLSAVDVAVSEFFQVIQSMGLENQVTLFSASDFGRSLSSNGDGSDHAWGGNHFVVGGAVNGGKIFGTYPQLALESELDFGRGRMIPTTSVDEYLAELAIWMGASTSSLTDTILPNLSRFYDSASGTPPLGLMT
ncbi:DUF1501 domain-containing protein [bacterium]|nr:DUF1501 domain-containing protein [bacterium]